VDVFNAGDVAAKQAGTLFDVALGEFLFLAQFADAITNYHRGIISSRRLEGKQGVLVRKKPSEHRAVCKVRPTATR